MAQFTAFEPEVEVKGDFILAIINTYPPSMRNLICQVLGNFKLKNICKDEWYSQQLVLDYMHHVYLRQGYNTIYSYGKMVYDHLLLPQKSCSIENELLSLNEKMKSFHRHGDCGEYRFEISNKTEDSLLVCSNTPFPCDFDRGLLTQLARMYKLSAKVMIVVERETKRKGFDESWFSISSQRFKM